MFGSQWFSTVWALTFALLALPSCRNPQAKLPCSCKMPVATPAQELASLTEQWWEFVLKQAPHDATYQGDHRYDDQLPDLSIANRDSYYQAVQRYQRQLAQIKLDALSSPDQLTHRVFAWTLQKILDHRACHFALWDVDQMYGPQVWFAELPRYHKLVDQGALKALLHRYQALPRMFAQYRANLDAGITKGWTAPKLIVERVIGQFDDLLAVPPEKSAFAKPLSTLPKDWSRTRRSAATKQLHEAIKTAVYKALGDLRHYLKHKYLPRARSAVGLAALKGGRACYQVRIKYVTGMDHSPEQIHDIGNKELARLQVQMVQIGKRMGHDLDAAALIKKLRTDPAMYARSKEQLLAKARTALARAKKALPQILPCPPQTPVFVRPMPPSREKDAPAAYYFQAPDDHSRPATFRLNTYNLKARPLFGIEALTFHEAIPGHHLQIALAKEQKDLPRFRRRLYQIAFMEGWALYSELLADELGLYSDQASRFGKLSFQAWRAARLVIDTGLHALGWTRKQAIDFLLRTTALCRADAINEVDRYISQPGQALGYMLGRMFIQRLRQRAEQKLGSRFDLRCFHEELLKRGALPLDILAEQIERWIEAVLHSPGGQPDDQRAEQDQASAP